MPEYVPATPAATILTNVLNARQDAEKTAWRALARYKFQMFGYWAAKWVTLNKLLPRDLRQPNPWAPLVIEARTVISIVAKTARKE